MLLSVFLVVRRRPFSNARRRSLVPDEGQLDFAWVDLCWDKYQSSSERRFAQVQVAEKWKLSDASCAARGALGS